MEKSLPTFFFFLFVFSIARITGQVVNQDDKGFSSIFLPAANINIDGTNNIITLSYSKLINEKKSYLNYTGFNIDQSYEEYLNCIQSKKKKTSQNWANEFKKDNKKTIGTDFLLGVNFSGQSSNGLSIILNEGLLSSQSSAQGVFGVQITKKNYDKRFIEDYAKNKEKYHEILSRREINEKKIKEYIAALERVNYFTKKRFTILNHRFNKEKDEDLLKAINLTIQEFDNYKPKEHGESIKLSLEKLTKELVTIKEKVDATISIIKSIQSTLSSDSGNSTSSIVSMPEEVLKTLLMNREEVNYMIKVLTEEYSKKYQIKLESGFADNFDLSNWKKLQKSLNENIRIFNVKLNSIEAFYTSRGNEEIKFLKVCLKEYGKDLETIVKLSKDMQKIQKKQLDYNKHIFYGRLGFSGSTFRFNLDNDSTLLSDRIEKRDFQGNRFEIGYTHQFKTVNYFGFNLAREYRDNSTLLTETEVEFKTIDISVEPNLEVSNTIKVLSGDYDKFDEYQLSLDYVRMIPLRELTLPAEKEKTTDLYLSLNPYLRHRFYANAENLSPDFSIGLGLYTFNINKNSIAGGAFVQANDIFNQNRDDALEFTKQLSIGLVFKYAIKSFNPKD